MTTDALPLSPLTTDTLYERERLTALYIADAMVDHGLTRPDPATIEEFRLYRDARRIRG